MFGDNFLRGEKYTPADRQTHSSVQRTAKSLGPACQQTVHYLQVSQTRQGQRRAQW